MKETTLARAFGVDRSPAPDPLSGLALRETYRAGGQTLDRQMIRDVAAVIRDALAGGVRASEIAERVEPIWGGAVYGTDRTIDRALQILRSRGVIRQGKYPRWIWTRGTTNASKESKA